MPVEKYDLCVVGSGLAGLNVLKVASSYLPKNSKILLIDKNKQAGGMWNEVYSYVRLHQPFQHFTAGDIKWTQNLPPDHLANKAEVLNHLNHCLNEIEKHFQIDKLFEHEMISCLEKEEILIELRPLPHGPIKSIKTQKLVKAFGANISNYSPLSFKSSNLHSLVPHSPELFSESFAKDSKPVYIVGGGKTAMDIAYKLVKAYPKKDLHLFIGKGTNFINREIAFPTGLKKYWSGTPMTSIIYDIASTYFDKGFEAAMEKFKGQYALNLDPKCERFFSGILSQEENDTIKKGVAGIYLDYLLDIEDDKGELKGVLKSNKSFHLPKGSWVINCTGYFYHSPTSFEPYLSKAGNILSIQQTSGISPFSSFGSYYLAHVFFMDKAQNLPFYQLNHHKLHNTDKDRYLFVSFFQILHNVILSLDHIPLKAMMQCDLNFDVWFPIHRQALVMLHLYLQKGKLFQKCKAHLDEFNKTSPIKCEPLSWIQNK